MRDFELFLTSLVKSLSLVETLKTSSSSGRLSQPKQAKGFVYGNDICNKSLIQIRTTCKQLCRYLNRTELNLRVFLKL